MNRQKLRLKKWMNHFFSDTGLSENRQAMIALAFSALLVAGVSLTARLTFKGHFLASAEEQPIEVIMEGVVR